MNNGKLREIESLQRICKPLLDWYGNNRRELEWRQKPLPYYVWVSEVMLQQTRVETVRPYFSRFVRTLPAIRDLAVCDEDRLLKLWEGLGYYSRARSLKKSAQLLMEQYGGELPADVDALKKLPGIGSYTAGAIASIAFGIPAPAVDGNVLRVLTRILACEDCIDDPKVKAGFEDWIRAFLVNRSGGILQKEGTAVWQDETVSGTGSADAALQDEAASGTQDSADAALQDEAAAGTQGSAGAALQDETGSGTSVVHPGDFNQALMELGAVVCLPNGMPLCDECPVSQMCFAKNRNLISVIPVRKKKRDRRIEKKTVLVIRDSERTLIRKRPDKGLLAGLWEFPNYEGHLTQEQALRQAKLLGVSPVRIRPLPEVRHIFTHVEWDMTGYLILAEEMSETTYLAARIRKAEEEYSIPGAFARYAAWLEIKRTPEFGRSNNQV